MKTNNVLTFSRILLTPVVLIFFYAPLEILKTFGLFLFIAIATTDLLDGYLARKWKTESRIGMMLDPLADKLMYLSILIMLFDLSYIGHKSIWALFVILFRELFVMGVRTMTKNSKETSSSTMSKIKTLIINFSVFCFLLNIAIFQYNNQILIYLAHSSFYVGSILAILTCTKYFRILWNLLEKEK